MSDTDTALRAAVTAHNRIWTAGSNEGTADLYHPDAVFVGQGLDRRVEGRDAIVASYDHFLAAATIDAFDETAWSVDVDGDTAVVAYTFAIRYTMGGETHAETGQEILVFTRRDDAWRVAWRTQVAAAPPA